jgi:hypothetical protein
MMRKAAAVLALALALAPVPSGGEDEGIAWLSSLDEARARAARERKPIFVVFR